MASSKRLPGETIRMRAHNTIAMLVKTRSVSGLTVPKAVAVLGDGFIGG
jgi:hypothetical protein